MPHGFDLAIDDDGRVHAAAPHAVPYVHGIASVNVYPVVLDRALVRAHALPVLPALLVLLVLHGVWDVKSTAVAAAAATAMVIDPFCVL